MDRRERVREVTGSGGSRKRESEAADRGEREREAGSGSKERERVGRAIEGEGWEMTLFSTREVREREVRVISLENYSRHF